VVKASGFCTSIELKQKMVSLIFPEKLIFEDKKYRTTKMNDVFALILRNRDGSDNKGKEKGQQICQPFLVWLPRLDSNRRPTD
jgi:hypothetical protein